MLKKKKKKTKDVVDQTAARYRRPLSISRRLVETAIKKAVGRMYRQALLRRSHHISIQAVDMQLVEVIERDAVVVVLFFFSYQFYIPTRREGTKKKKKKKKKKK